jgi:hypothetical protein
VTPVPLEPWHRLRVTRERALRRIGWAGIVGCVLTVSSIGIVFESWKEEAAFEKARAASSTSDGAIVVLATSPALQPVVDLPTASDIPLFLTRMEQAALGNGLEWRAAEYRITSATAAQPASLEVRCAISGAYPKLRGMLVQLTKTLPAFSIRGFDLARPTADVAEVEAKLVLAVFLQDSASERAVPVKGGS